MSRFLVLIAIPALLAVLACQRIRQGTSPNADLLAECYGWLESGPEDSDGLR